MNSSTPRWIALFALLSLAAWVLSRRQAGEARLPASPAWAPAREEPPAALSASDELLYGENALPDLNHQVDNIRIASRLL